MSAFTPSRRVASCPLKTPPQNTPKPQCANAASLTEQQKRQMRQMRFSAGNDASDCPKGKVDPKSYGFVSRGEDSRLQNSESAQREYFDWILETFKQVEKADSASPGSLDTNNGDSPKSSTGSEQVLASLRKLREALLQQGASEFSKKVHLFSIRVSSAVGHYQTYVPSIQYLLSDADELLTSAERAEIASLLVLHVSHRNGNASEALGVFFQYLDPQKDGRILQSVLAWAQGDFHAWMALYNSESDHSLFAVMTMGLSRIMDHMIACFSVSYYTYGMEGLKKCLPKGVTWDQFKEKYAVSWELEESTVHIRRRQPRTKNQASSGGTTSVESGVSIDSEKEPQGAGTRGESRGK